MRLLTFAFAMALPGTALAEAPAPKYRPITLEVPGIKLTPRPVGSVPHAPTSRIIFLHRCPDTGCVILQGDIDDSRTNQSSLAQGTRTIGAFTRGDAVWANVVKCVKATYAPFDVEVTDVDPGNVPHFEHIVGGVNSDLRNDIQGAGGVSPASCSEIPNAITYTFDVWGNNFDVICGVVAQETAHAFGLEHEMNKFDPLTYLSGPDVKRFQAADAICGEYEPFAGGCRCGGTMQNSYEYLLAKFGQGVATAPSIEIRSPSSGKTVQPGFLTRVEATDDVAVGRVELLVDDEIVTESMEAPFNLIAPDGIAEGPHTIIARAYDVQGTPAQTEPLAIVMGPPCTAGSGCSDPDVCVMGVCQPGPSVGGGLGYFCTADTECISMQCVNAGGQGQCVAPCDLSPGSCPSDFECIPAGSAGVCWYNGEGGCCDAGGRGGAGAMLLGLGVLLVVGRRRRPR